MKVNEKKLQDLNKKEFYEALTICNKIQMDKGKQPMSDGDVIKYAMLTNSLTREKVAEFLKDN